MFPSFSCLTAVWEKCLEALESQIMLGESLLVHGIAKPSSEQSEACAPSNWMRETREFGFAKEFASRFRKIKL